MGELDHGHRHRHHVRLFLWLFDLSSNLGPGCAQYVAEYLARQALRRDGRHAALGGYSVLHRNAFGGYEWPDRV